MLYVNKIDLTPSRLRQDLELSDMSPDLPDLLKFLSCQTKQFNGIIAGIPGDFFKVTAS